MKKKIPQYEGKVIVGKQAQSLHTHDIKDITAKTNDWQKATAEVFKKAHELDNEYSDQIPTIPITEIELYQSFKPYTPQFIPGKRYRENKIATTFRMDDQTLKTEHMFMYRIGSAISHLEKEVSAIDATMEGLPKLKFSSLPMINVQTYTASYIGENELKPSTQPSWGIGGVQVHMFVKAWRIKGSKLPKIPKIKKFTPYESITHTLANLHFLPTSTNGYGVTGDLIDAATGDIHTIGEYVTWDNWLEHGYTPYVPYDEAEYPPMDADQPFPDQSKSAVFTGQGASGGFLIPDTVKDTLINKFKTETNLLQTLSNPNANIKITNVTMGVNQPTKITGKYQVIADDPDTHETYAPAEEIPIEKYAGLTKTGAEIVSEFNKKCDEEFLGTTSGIHDIEEPPTKGKWDEQ